MPSIITQSFLSPVGFNFKIHRLPNVAYYVQQATIPGLSMGITEQPSPFKTIYHAGDKITFDQFTIAFAVDENFANYQEIFNWMVGLTYPSKFEEYANLKAGDGLYSDATLTVLSSNKAPNINITFKDIFPTSLSSISMDTTSTNITYAKADVSFQINSYAISKTI